MRTILYLYSLYLTNVSGVCLNISSILSFRVIILAWNRPHSLLRLISSLERSDYTFQGNNPGWDIKVQLRLDGGGGAEGEKVKQIAEDWNCSFGSKVCY